MSQKIWVVLQQRDGVLHRLSTETIAAGQRLASQTGGTVEAVLLGGQVDGLAEELAAKCQIEALYVANHDALANYSPGTYVSALAPAIRTVAPRYVLFPHTYQSMDYFPRLAQEVEGSIVSGVEGFTLHGDDIHWQRPVLGGKLQAQVRVTGSGTALISIQSGTFSADDLIAGSTTVTPLPLGELTPDRELLGIEQAGEEEVDLSKASVIVAAGRGVGGAEKMSVIEDLANVLGADIGASRPVIDNGWLPRDRQIGSSGQTVAPKLYVAIGISGAIQHLVGMKGSGCVVAINKDPNAPIFSVADYGLVGDLHEIVPALTAALRDA